MLMLTLDALLCILAALLLVPVSIFTIEIAAAVGLRGPHYAGVAPRPEFAILIPAHNEEAGIADTLRSITPQLTVNDRLIVVADNCTDATRTVAEAEGAEVLSRTDPEKRGKGFALDFGIQHLRSTPPAIVVIVDADCYVITGALDLLARECAGRRRPIQAQYLMKNKTKPGLKMRVAEFAWLVKNLARPSGLANLNLPCQLMGSGMAFPWASISSLNLADGHIVEDMKMGLDLARLGVAPTFCAEALVLSTFPTQEEGIKSQRTRWEHGHLSTILSEAPKMLLQGLKRLEFPLIALAADLCVPPLALLLLQVAGLWFVTAAFFAVSGRFVPLLMMSVASILFGVSVVTAWVGYGRKVISFADLMSACLYPISKFPTYVGFVFSRQSEWVRSKRDKER